MGKEISAKEIVSERVWEAIEKVFEVAEAVKAEIPQEEFEAEIEGQIADLVAEIIVLCSTREVSSLNINLDNRKIIAKIEG